MKKIALGKKRRAETAANTHDRPASDAGAPRAHRPEADDAIGCIKVLGSGCAACHALYENTLTAVQAMGVSAEVVYITDLQTVMHYGVMRMPALVVDEEVRSAGRILKPTEVQKLLQSEKD